MPEERSDLREELLSQLEQLVTGLNAEEREKLRDDFQLIRQLVNAVADSRPPRILILGDPTIPLASVIEELGALPSHSDDFYTIHEELGRGRWQNWALEPGVLEVCDARSADLNSAPVKALRFERPDLVVSLVMSGSKAPGRVLELCRLLQVIEEQSDFCAPALLAIHRPEHLREVADFVTLQALKQELVENGKSRDAYPVVQLSRSGKLLKAALEDLRDESRFGLARVTHDVDTKRALAQSVIRAATSINASIASVPIPVASSLPITSVQIMMITAIAWLSGREISRKTLGEFAAALGLNLGAAFAFRELARALVNWIPVAGSLISAAIAAGATQSLGKAAMRYFIDGESKLN